jgi:hypothetical protein
MKNVIVKSDINPIKNIPNMPDCPEYDLDVKTDINVTRLAIKVWAEIR